MKSGDTLSEIAKANGVSVADILKANPDIDNPDVIKAGQKIIIPHFKTVTPEPVKKTEPEVKTLAPAPEEKSWWQKATSWFTGGDEKPKAKHPENYNDEGEGDLGGEVYVVPEIKKAEESIRKHAKNAREAEEAIKKLHNLISEIDDAGEEDLRALKERSQDKNGFITTLKKLNPFTVNDAEAAVPLVLAAEACAVNPACAAGLAALGAATLVAGKNAIESTYEFVKKLHDGSNSDNVKKQKITTAASSGGMPDSDDDEQQKERKFNVHKSESKIWKELQHYKGKTKTNGLSGSKKEYYQWDHTHNDIEVYDSNMRHLGSKDPQSGKIIKGPVTGRKINTW